jgi:hypothetical protein
MEADRMTRALSRGSMVVALLAALPIAAVAASPAAKNQKQKDPAKVVELFAGMKSGEIEVKVFPKDAKEGTVMIKNKTGKPLSIKVPEVLAGVPVLAQGLGVGGGLGANNAGGGTGYGGGTGGGNQGFGGGMMGGMGGMMGGMGGGMGGMGGFFNVAPDKVAKFKLVTVCLDHGLKDPNPRIPYELVPIENYAKDSSVTEVLKLMVQGKIDQHSAQAAAWHLQNGLSWEELATKIGVKHLDGSVEAYFNPGNLTRALAATREAQRRVEATKEKRSVESLAKE